MSNVIDDLGKVINSKVHVPIATDKGNVVLKEDALNAQFSQIEITGLPEKSFVILMDYREKGFLRYSHFLSGYKGINKRCDYILFTIEDNRKTVIFCELKSDNPRKASSQISSTVPFIKFIDEVLISHFKTTISEFEHKYICFTSNKNGTNVGEVVGRNENIPIKLLKYSKQIHFKKLIQN